MGLEIGFEDLGAVPTFHLDEKVDGAVAGLQVLPEQGLLQQGQDELAIRVELHQLLKLLPRVRILQHAPDSVGAGGVADLEASSPLTVGAIVFSRGSGAAALGLRSSPAGDLPRPSPSTAAWREAILAEIAVARTVTIVQAKWIRQAFMKISSFRPYMGRRAKLECFTFSPMSPGNSEQGNRRSGPTPTSTT